MRNIVHSSTLPILIWLRGRKANSTVHHTIGLNNIGECLRQGQEKSLTKTRGFYHRDTTREPSHSRGALGVPEPLTLGAQYLTRYNTWKNFVRVTRTALTYLYMR